jgi:hypothetical protein
VHDVVCARPLPTLAVDADADAGIMSGLPDLGSSSATDHDVETMWSARRRSFYI